MKYIALFLALFIMIAPGSAEAARNPKFEKVPAINIKNNRKVMKPIFIIEAMTKHYRFETGLISVSVIGANSVSLSNATIQIDLDRYSYPYPTAFSSQTLVTDSQGDASLSDILPGWYKLKVSADGYITHEENYWVTPGYGWGHVIGLVKKSSGGASVGSIVISKSQ